MVCCYTCAPPSFALSSPPPSCPASYGRVKEVFGEAISSIPYHPLLVLSCMAPAAPTEATRLRLPSFPPRKGSSFERKKLNCLNHDKLMARAINRTITCDTLMRALPSPRAGCGHTVPPTFPLTQPLAAKHCRDLRRRSSRGVPLSKVSIATAHSTLPSRSPWHAIAECEGGDLNAILPAGSNCFVMRRSEAATYSAHSLSFPMQYAARSWGP